MYRVYLDWNVFTMLRKNAKDSTSVILKEILKENKHIFLIPYTQAHMQDLLKGSDKNENQHFILKDLELIDKITNKHFFDNDILNDKMIPRIVNSRNIFDSAFKGKDEDVLNPNYYQKLFKEAEMPILGKLFLNQWKSQPTGIDFKNNTENDFYQNFLIRTKQEDNLYNFMLDLSDFNNQLKQNPNKYNSLINTALNSFGIHKGAANNSSNPIETFNKKLSDKNYDFSFEQLSTLPNENNDPFLGGHFLKYNLEYVNLNMSGYHTDKLNEKNQYTNFVADGQHSFYGGFCDYLVSNEKKLVKKSNVLYQRYGLHSKALSPSEFIETFGGFNKEIENLADFYKVLKSTIQDNLVEEITKFNETQNERVFLYKPKNKIFSYFNYIQGVSHSDNRTSFHLINVRKTFSKFEFYTEIDFLINKCIDVFGGDQSNQGVLSDKDKKEISEGNWEGRFWLVSGFAILLNCDNDHGRMKLLMEQITMDYIQKLKDKGILKD